MIPFVLQARRNLRDPDARGRVGRRPPSAPMQCRGASFQAVHRALGE
jgi:hypothetical protein